MISTFVKNDKYDGSLVS